MIFWKLAIAACEIVEVNVIFEKVMKEDSIRVAEFLLRQSLAEYSNFFSEAGIRFKLKSFLDFGRYSKLPEYADFVAADSQFKKKHKSLSDLPGNLIALLATSEDVPKLKKVSPCRGRYYAKIGRDASSDELAILAVNTTREWIEQAFHVKLPDVMEEHHERIKVALSKKAKAILNVCRVEMYESEEDGNAQKSSYTTMALLKRPEDEYEMEVSNDFTSKPYSLLSDQHYTQYRKPLLKKFPALDK